MAKDFETAKEGLNCVTLIHIVYREVFGVSLAPSLRAIELYFQNDFFESPDLSSKKQVGDIAFWARDNVEEVLTEYRPAFDVNGNLIGKCPFHLAMYIGENKKDEALFVHANFIDKNVGIWTEKRIRSYIRYSTLLALKRCKLLTK